MRREIFRFAAVAAAAAAAFFTLSSFIGLPCGREEPHHAGAASGQGRDSVAILFWNLENYFDNFDDPERADDDFTPRGVKRWSRKRFERKRNAIAKALIASAGECGGLPAIIAFAEVENKTVLRRLISDTPMAKFDYDIIHRDSPDRRGIDVAAIYRKSRFKPLKVSTITVECEPPTRDILYVKGILLASGGPEGDTLHLFVNHWPSKMGGERASLPRRMAAAKALGRAADSILVAAATILNSDLSISDEQPRKVPLIVATGDFNDTPGSAPLRFAGRNLVNLAEPLAAKGLGTIRYNGNWELIDHFLVSSALNPTSPPANAVKAAEMLIHAPDYLLERDSKYLGLKPRRTYIGPRHNGGISDHLPIILKFFIYLPR